MQAAKIVLLCVASAVLYGIAHDQVTARLCVEYFTVAHPPIFGGLTSPTLLAFGWGLIATWWMGILLGVPLVAFARAGRRPKLVASDFVRPIACLLAVMATLAAIAGVVGFFLARSSFGRSLAEIAPITRRIAESMHPPFFADAFAHEMSYLAGGLGGVVVWAWAWRRRGQRARQSSARGMGENRGGVGPSRMAAGARDG